MHSSKVSKRYSKGLYDFATETNQLDAVSKDMKDLVVILKNSQDLSTFFNNPFIDSKKKSEASIEIFKSFSSLSNNFIQLCINNGREKNLQEIAKHFNYTVEDKNQIQRISITSASELSKANVDNILAESKIVDSSKKTKVKIIVKPDLIGGYIIRVGDQQIDLSVKNQLNTLRKELQVK